MIRWLVFRYWMIRWLVFRYWMPLFFWKIVCFFRGHDEKRVFGWHWCARCTKVWDDTEPDVFVRLGRQ